jgi:hypothetical protein
MCEGRYESAPFYRPEGGGEQWRSLTPARRARRDETLHYASAETAPSLRANNFSRGVGDGYIKLECAAYVSGPLLFASFFVVSGVPGASPVYRGRARVAGHRIGPHRTEGGFGHAAGNKNLSSTS